VIATVKGDVHDIGKNIVAVVLGCNNYKVTSDMMVLFCHLCDAIVHRHSVHAYRAASAENFSTVS
jgi:cobalamin-dependent methionine synthase I